ncbi:MAG: SUMF1/EgtB/PvdO family nonheme iron enzyme [Chthonomonadales bacterium]
MTILGIVPGATDDEIKKAYRDLVKVWHPDRFSNDPELQHTAQEKLKSITTAYGEIQTYQRNMADESTKPEPKKPQSYPTDPGKPIDHTPVDVRVNSKDGAELVFVPGGRFVIGSIDQDDAGPRDVTVSDFWIYRTPVTVAHYRKYTESPDGPAMPDSPPWGWMDDHPIVNVSAQDAEGYARWAGARLPTEEEWEKAASWDHRNDRKLHYPWGNNWDVRQLWSSEHGKKTKTNPVGMIESGASPYGAYDMAGNVWEWTSSPFVSVEGLSAGHRVLRGGSWGTIGPGRFRSAFRNDARPDTRNMITGFRCATKR